MKYLEIKFNKHYKTSLREIKEYKIKSLSLWMQRLIVSTKWPIESVQSYSKSQ